MSAGGLAMSTGGVAAGIGLGAAATNSMGLAKIGTIVGSGIASVGASLGGAVSSTALSIADILPAIGTVSSSTGVLAASSLPALIGGGALGGLLGAYYLGQTGEKIKAIGLGAGVAGAVSYSIPLMALGAILFAGKSFSDNLPEFKKEAK